MVSVSAAVEGLVDEAVAKRIISETGGLVGTVYGKAGKTALRGRMAGYNSAARHAPWFVLVDLDHEADCAARLRREWISAPASQLCFRVAVREIEAWLMADKERLARFLSIPIERIPDNPETVENPKEQMVQLAASSKERDIREDMVPRPNSGRTVGPAYTSRLIEFVTIRQNGWRPDVAQTRANSLQRAITCLRRLIAATS